MAFDFNEKRRFPRIGLRAPVNCKIRGAVQHCQNAISNDVSLGGISFTNDNFIAPKTLLMLEINVLSRLLSPVARVAWINSLSHSNKYHLGLEFVEVDPVEKRYLGDYIDMQRGTL